jgi:hypothetical protein
MRERTECASELKEQSGSAGVAGKYACTVAAGNGRREPTLLIRPGPALDAAALTGKARR